MCNCAIKKYWVQHATGPLQLHPRQHNHMYVYFFIFSLLPAFLLQALQLHLCADWLPMIWARRPSRLDYWSFLTAAYLMQGRSEHDSCIVLSLSTKCSHCPSCECICIPKFRINSLQRIHRKLHSSNLPCWNQLEQQRRFQHWQEVLKCCYFLLLVYCFQKSG